MSCQSPQGLKVFQMDPQSNTCFIIGFNMSSQLSRSGLIQAAGSPEKTVKWWSSLTRGVVSGICLIFSPSWSRSRLAITQHSGFAGRWLSMDMGRAGQGGPSMWSCTWHLGVGSGQWAQKKFMCNITIYGRRWGQAWDGLGAHCRPKNVRRELPSVTWTDHHLSF